METPTPTSSFVHLRSELSMGAELQNTFISFFLNKKFSIK